MAFDEVDIEHAPAAPLRLVVSGEDALAEAENRGDVAAWPNLVILSADAGLVAGQHLADVLWVDEIFEALFANRIEGDDRNASPRDVLKRMEKAGTVRSRILAKEEHGVAFLKVAVDDRADPDADQFLERHRGRLVAHVRAVRQIVVAVHPRHQRIEIGRLQAGAAGSIENDRFGIERLELGPDRGEGFVPFAGLVAVPRSVEAHRMGETALLLEVMVLPRQKLREAVAGEELRLAAAGGQFPKRRLGAVLAKLERMIIGGLRPGAGDAHEAVRLVLPCEGLQGAGSRPFFAEDAGDAAQRSPSPGRCCSWMRGICSGR